MADRGGESISDPGELYPESLDMVAAPKLRPSRLGVRCGMIDLHTFAEVGDDRGEVGDCADGEYFKTISVHRWNTGSGMCNFQLTADRKAISLVLISHVLSPDILLQARAEKFRS